MSEETIQVVFKPVAANGWHETMVYTARDGHREYASAYASSTTPAGSPASDLAGAGSAASHHHAGGGSPYGTLETESGQLDRRDDALIFGPPGARLPAETLARGSDLSSQWAKVREAYREVGSAHYTYSPLTQNSNSAASTAMVAAGLTPPQDNGLVSHHWTPAADNILPIPAVRNRRTAQSAESAQVADDETQALWRRSAGLSSEAPDRAAAAERLQLRQRRAPMLRA